MQILIDSNIVLRLVEPTDPQHDITLKAIDTLRRSGHQLVIVPQVLYEFWCSSTRTTAANGLGKDAKQAEQYIQKFGLLFRLLKDERAIYEKWLTLVTQHDVTGVKSYDTRLVAAMSRHEITHILTFNAKDFRRYANITVIEPQAVTEST